MQMENALERIVVSVKNSAVTLYTSEEVFELLANTDFQASWDALYQGCPWATVFQSRDFVASWYQVYRSRYMPVVVTKTDNGRLTGLLTMAKGSERLIFGAGESQAEYQVWIAVSSDNDGFIAQAISAIRKRFPKNKIQFKYIPGKASLNWIKKGSAWSHYGVIQTFEQPLLNIDDENISNELRKKNRREKVNRLKRMGKLEFECITDPELFSSLFDHLALQSDFRKAAMYNRTFFLIDPLRKEFLMTLFKCGLLHVSILRLGNEVIASNVSVAGKNWVHLQGMNSHDPVYSKYSPGILHFLMLGKQLATEGVEIFDFTPGTHAYKDALATDYTIAHSLVIGSFYNQLVGNIKLGLNRSFKKGAVRIGLKLETIKKFKSQIELYKDKLKSFKKLGVSVLMENSRIKSRQLPQARTYVVQAAWQNDISNLSIRRNCLTDLLAFEPRGSWLSRWEFLQQAMSRLEVGQTAYTWSEEGRLVACVWLNQSKPTSNGTQAANSLVTVKLEGAYYHPQFYSLLKTFDSAVIHQVVLALPGTMTCMEVASQDSSICHTLEMLGLRSTC